MILAPSTCRWAITFALRAAVTKVASATKRSSAFISASAHLVLFSWRHCEAAELHGAVHQIHIQDADGLRMTAARKMEMSRVRWQASQSHDRRVPWRLARLQAASTIVCSLHIKVILIPLHKILVLCPGSLRGGSVREDFSSVPTVPGREGGTLSSLMSVRSWTGRESS